MFLICYGRSSFRDFECYLRIVVGLDEDDIQLNLKQYFPTFIKYQILPGVYSIEDVSVAAFTMGDHESTIQIKYDDISMKTKLLER